MNLPAFIATNASGDLYVPDLFNNRIQKFADPPNVPPTAVDDPATVAEDSGATAIPVLANDTDPEGDPRTITSATDPANGTVVLTGGTPGAHTGLTYQPDPNYCNDPDPAPVDTFDYTINGGDSATVSVTVTCVDDNPTAVDDTATVDEDSDATAVAVLANDTDPEGDPRTITSATDPANGTVVLTGGTPGAHTGLTYQPDPNYCNDPDPAPVDTFDYTINGGDTATVSVTVTCVADPPAGGVGTSADTVAPETTIDSKRIRRAARKATFTFSSNEPGSTFLCKLDKKPFRPCSSPKKIKRLRPGKHKLRIAARDAAGNLDVTPALKKFKIP